MGIIRGLIGLAVIFFIAFLFCKEKKSIKYKNIILMVVVQVVLTFLLLNTSVGLTVLSAISNFFTWLTAQGMTGCNFVFGGIQIGKGASVFFFNVLMPLVFISALIGILKWLGVLDFIVKWIGWIFNKVTGLGEVESYVPIATTLLGSPQIFMTIKSQIKKMNYNQLFTVCLTVISGMSASMLASYMTMIDGKYVVIAVVLNLFSGLIISAIMNPYDEKIATADEEESEEKKERAPFFSMLGDYISSGFDLAIIVAAMCIGFISLISFLNNGLAAICGISFTDILGYVFAPIACVIGVPLQDAVRIGGLMATKLLTNEFVAMGQVAGITTLTAKSVAMISVYLVSFVNFGTLGIISGAVKSISDEKATDVAKFSLKLILGGTLAGLLSATIVGVFF